MTSKVSCQQVIEGWLSTGFEEGTNGVFVIKSCHEEVDVVVVVDGSSGKEGVNEGVAAKGLAQKTDTCGDFRVPLVASGVSSS